MNMFSVWLILIHPQLSTSNDCCEDGHTACESLCNCMHTVKGYNDTICYAEDLQVNVILKGVHVLTKNLTIQVPNNIVNKQLRLNLFNINRLVSLEYFKLFPENYDVYEAFELLYNNDTFRNLTSLKYVAINIVIWNQSFRDLVEPLTNLEVLDLSNTHNLLYKNLEDVVKGLENKRYFSKLLASAFQVLDMDFYTAEIDLSKLLKPLRNSPVKELDLSWNGIIRLLPGITVYTPKLEVLDVSQNLLVGDSVSPFINEAVIHPTIKMVNYANQGIISASAKDRIYSNLLEEYEHNKPVIIQQKKDTTLHMPPQRIVSPVSPTCIEYFTAEKSFELAYLICNYRYVLCDVLKTENPIDYKGMPCSALPILKNIWNTDCYKNADVPFLPSGEKLILDNLEVGLGGNIGRLFRSSGKSALCFGRSPLKEISFSFNANWIKTLSLDSNLNTMIIHGAETLEKLYVQHNDMEVDVLHMIASFPLLRYIYFQGNKVILKENYDICGNNTFLEVVDFSLNNIKIVHENAIRSCIHLHHLYFHNNYLQDFPVDLTPSFDSLQYIDLKNNDIAILSEQARLHLSNLFTKQDPKVTIDITGNPISCGCSINKIEFIEWVQKYKDHFLGYDNYTCSGRGGNTFIYKIDPVVLYRDCYPSSDVTDILTGIFIALAFVLIVVLIIIIYKKRWRIRYHIFTLQYKLKGFFQPRNVEYKKYTFDLYVSYSTEDRFWVLDVLTKTLEEQYGFKLCIHVRDFRAGSSIQENIENCMSDSREIMMVISEGSMNRPWCDFELNVAECEMINRKKKLIIVVLGNFPLFISNEKLANILSIHTYIPWPENPDGKPIFFRKIIDVLYCKDKIRHGSESVRQIEAFANQ